MSAAALQTWSKQILAAIKRNDVSNVVAAFSEFRSTKHMASFLHEALVSGLPEMVSTMLQYGAPLTDDVWNAVVGAPPAIWNVVLPWMARSSSLWAQKAVTQRAWHIYAAMLAANFDLPSAKVIRDNCDRMPGTVVEALIARGVKMTPADLLRVVDARNLDAARAMLRQPGLTCPEEILHAAASDYDLAQMLTQLEVVSPITLCYALLNRTDAVCALLLDNGVDASAAVRIKQAPVYSSEVTPLEACLMACCERHTFAFLHKMVPLLCAHGADINQLSMVGWGTTLLMVAVQAGFVEHVRVLLDNGAKTMISTSEGDTAFDMLRITTSVLHPEKFRAVQREMADLLKQHTMTARIADPPQELTALYSIHSTEQRDMLFWGNTQLRTRTNWIDLSTLSLSEAAWQERGWPPIQVSDNGETCVLQTRKPMYRSVSVVRTSLPDGTYSMRKISGTAFLTPSGVGCVTAGNGVLVYHPELDMSSLGTAKYDPSTDGEVEQVIFNTQQCIGVRHTSMFAVYQLPMLKCLGAYRENVPQLACAISGTSQWVLCVQSGGLNVLLLVDTLLSSKSTAASRANFTTAAPAGGLTACLNIVADFVPHWDGSIVAMSCTSSCLLFVGSSGYIRVVARGLSGTRLVLRLPLPAAVAEQATPVTAAEFSPDCRHCVFTTTEAGSDIEEDAASDDPDHHDHTLVRLPNDVFQWSPALHCGFPLRFRQRVMAVLCGAQADRCTGLPRYPQSVLHMLPLDMWFLIFEFMSR